MVNVITKKLEFEFYGPRIKINDPETTCIVLR